MAQSNQSVVRTAGLTKVFHDFWLRAKVTAVADLELEIHPQEVFGLLGPNGSGKSTTLKMLLGLMFPTKGSIAVFGKHPTNVGAKSRIGYLPEESNLYPFLDARETLDFYGRLFHLPRAQRRRRIDMLLEMVGLAAVAYRRVGEYSKGMQRRIGLAQALINDPDLLILDEPTSGLDPLGTRQFKDLIVTLARRGKTVILSSHLLADVEDVCDRVCILYGGRKRAEGPIQELLSQQGKTQITTEELDEAALQRVRAAIEGTGRDLLSVGAPRDRLESMFLNIVHDAQRQRAETGGAVATGHVADFLTGEDDTGQAVIEHLVRSSEPTPDETPAETPPAEAPSAPEPRREEVLEELVEARDEPPEPQPQPPAESGTPSAPAGGAQSTSQDQADRDLIDGLLGGENETDDSKPRGDSDS